MQIFTDGAAKNNGSKNNYGGNGFVVVINKEYFIHYTEVNRNTTNNQEELKSIISALKWVKKYAPKVNIILYSDSQYCINGINEWSIKWKKFGWKKSKNSKDYIKNVELWYQLDLLKRPNITFKWIKGHQNKNNWNDFIDQKIQEDISYR